jgi:hypothetical protein
MRTAIDSMNWLSLPGFTGVNKTKLLVGVGQYFRGV